MDYFMVEGLQNGLELVKSFLDKHLDLLRPSSQYYSMFKDAAKCNQMGIYDKPLPCFGCGIGWFLFLLGFVFPLMWYYATFLYLGNYYRKDPQELAGLSAHTLLLFFFFIWIIYQCKIKS
ncbi:hypothetical protein UlMin_000050 [Ulmus minor]